MEHETHSKGQEGHGKAQQCGVSENFQGRVSCVVLVGRITVVGGKAGKNLRY